MSEPTCSNVKEIVQVFLKLNKYDGLYNVDYECGCEINDLMPCDESYSFCTPMKIITKNLIG